MPISSDLPTSRRGYLSQDELEQFANITVTDASEADDVISQAEELIDSFVGYQPKFMGYEMVGRASAGTSNTLTLEDDHQNNYDPNYFKLCEIELIGGTGIGDRRRILSSTKPGLITVSQAWDTAPDSTSFYKISQLGKFPRVRDVVSHTDGLVTTYYKSIPEAVKRATAAQVQYMITMGENFFASDRANMKSESIGDYSYNLDEGISINLARLIAPKAKLLLRGYINRTGEIVA